MQPNDEPGPSRGPDRFDFAELFTLAVREILPRAAAKRLSWSFDCRGPLVPLHGDAAALQCSLHRLLCAALDGLEAGFLVFDAELTPGPDGWIATVKAAGTGTLAPDAILDAVLQRLQLREAAREHRAPASAIPLLRRARGSCPRTGAGVEFTGVPSQGLLLQWERRFVAEPADVDDEPGAGAARAWIVDADPGSAESLAHRLQRLGWATSKLHSTRQAQRRIAESAHGHARPALVIGRESDTVTLQDLRALVPLLPPDTACVLGVLAASGTLAAADTDLDVEVQVIPFSPQDLHSLTRRTAGFADAPSGATQPAPLLLQDRPPLLVVDDDEVNRIVATGLAESLGYDVCTACDGLDAIDACRRAAPAVVLMDLAMPRLGGVEAARRLRELQRSGAIPPFRIVAVTADSSARAMRECAEAGMDGFLTKPLLRPALAAELRRLRAGR